MSSSIFSSYLPPGVYTDTRIEDNSAGPPSGVLLPVIIGTGAETLSRSDFEMIRGSSAEADQLVNSEDVGSARMVLAQTGDSTFVLGAADGVATRFQVTRFPIVRGDGAGVTTNRPSDVVVTVNGVAVVPAGVRGELGLVTLSVPPQAGDDVRVTYRYKRRDTLITDDLSAQVTTTAAVLQGGLSSPFTVEAGVNDLLILTVDGATSQVTVPAVTGASAADMATSLNGLAIPGVTFSVDTDNLGRERLEITAQVSLFVGAGTFNAVAGLFNGQRTSRNAVFYTFQGPIVDGSDGGITTTNPADVTVLVNNLAVTPVAVDGTRRAVTLPAPPPPGATVTVQYHFNAWQDTFDDLPDLGVQSVSRVGNVPGKADYLEDADWVLEGDTLIWGAATRVVPVLTTAGFDPLDGTQVQPMLLDDRMYLEAATRFVDRTLTPPRTSDRVILLSNIPTLGNGRNTPLTQELFQSLSNGRVDVPANRPDLLAVYTGVDLSSALAAGPRVVTLIEATDRRVTLRDAIPPDHRVWATYYYNRLRDDAYTLEVVTQTSGLIPGQYRVTSRLTGQLVKDVRFGTLSGSDPVVWPSGVSTRPDAFVTSTSAVNETATVTFTQVAASPAVLTAPNQERYSMYAGASDQLYVTVDGGATTINLNVPAPGTLATAPLTAGGSFTFLTSDNVFSFELDGDNFTATFPPGTYSGPQVADRIQRAALPLSSATATVAGPYDILSAVTGTVPGPWDLYANILSTGFGPFDIFAQLTTSLTAPFDIITSQLGAIAGPYDLFAEIAGVNAAPFNTVGSEANRLFINGVQVDTTLTSGAAVPLATIISDLTASATTAGLTVGPLTVAGNDVEFADNGAGALQIRSTVSLEIGADGDSPSNLILGFTGGATDDAPLGFDLELNTIPVNVVLPGGEAVSAATVVAAIVAEIQNSTTLAVGALTVATNDVNVFVEAGAVRIQATESLNVLAGAANAVLGFTDNTLTLAPRDLDLTVNGVVVPTIQVNGGLGRSAAALAGEIRTGLAATLTNVGPLTTLTNVADVAVATGGALRFEAKVSLLVGAGSLNAVIGLVNGSSNTAANTLAITVNGSPVAVTFSGGRAIPSSVISSEINAAAALVFPGAVGVLTTFGNVFDALVTNTQQIDLQATQSIEVTGGTAGAVLGLPVTPSVAAPTAVSIVANGTPILFNFLGGRQVSAAQLRSELEAAATLAGEVGGDLSIPGNTVDAAPAANGAFRIRAVDNLQVNAVADSAYAVLGLTPTALITTADTLIFTAEGTPFTTTLTHGAGFSAATIASQVDAAAAIAGLTPGSLATPPNDFDALSITGGFLRVSSLTTLTVGAGTANSVFGFLAGALPANPTWVRYRSGATSDRLIMRSRVIPTGPSSVSRIRVLSGTANSKLGLVAFQQAEGTERAVNKPATILGRSVSSLSLNTLVVLNPVFAFRVNGTDYNAVGWGAVTNLGDVAVILNAAAGGAGTWTVEGSQLRLTSSLDTPDSLVEILPSPAAALLGWSGSERAGQRTVSAAEIAAVINWSTLSWTAPVVGEFPAAGYADVFQPAGTALRYLRLSTWESGGLRSLLLATGVDDALNDTGLGWAPGLSAVGTDPIDGFVVTSNAGAAGSSGSGVVGQTYTDARTGLRFTVLPAADSNYTPGDSFTLIVSDVFLTGNVPTLAMAGTETLVTSTAGVDIGSTALLSTFKGSGNEPAVGDFYYVSYQYAKPSLEARRYAQLRDVVAEFGPLDVENPLTLAAFLAFANGAAVVGLKQVLRQPGVSQASSVAYINAIKELERPFDGGFSPDVIVPLTGDPTVLSALKTSCEVQSSIRYRQERRAFVGVTSGTRPQDVSSIARGLLSERVVLVYPDSAVITLQDSLGQNETSLVDGYYLAVALAAVAVNPQFDVAEPLTRKSLAGFDRLNRFLDETEKNALAVAGVTVLEDVNQIVRVRHALTTNPGSVLTAEPTVRAIADFVQKRSRAVLDRFIGTKFLTSRAQDVESALTGLLNSLVEANIIKAFRNVEATPDRNNPTLLRVRAEYAPILPLLYIELIYTIRTNV